MYTYMGYTQCSPLANAPILVLLFVNKPLNIIYLHTIDMMYCLGLEQEMHNALFVLV